VGIINIIIVCLMTLPIYLRSGRTKLLTSGVQVTPGGIFKVNTCGVYSNLLYDKT